MPAAPQWRQKLGVGELGGDVEGMAAVVVVVVVVDVVVVPLLLLLLLLRASQRSVGGGGRRPGTTTSAAGRRRGAGDAAQRMRTSDAARAPPLPVRRSRCICLVRARACVDAALAVRLG
jgi:hypothetical protein